MKQLILLFTNSYARADLYWSIRSFFFPQQRWLTRVIPRAFCDKVELVPRVLFAILVDFVEKEKGLSQLDADWAKELEDGHVTQSYIDDINVTYGELRDAYNYIKHERDALQAAHDNSYPEMLPGVHGVFEEPTVDENGTESSCVRSCETLYGMSYAEAYAETNRLEALIEQRDQDAMMAIVRNVKVLWT
jgi:hypothetical protein